VILRTLKRVPSLLGRTLAYIEVNALAFLALVAGANILDALMTWGWITFGMATEDNPALAWVMDFNGGMASFLVLKIVTVTALIGILYLGTRRTKYQRAATLAVGFVFSVYSALMTWHAIGVLLAGKDMLVSYNILG